MDKKSKVALRPTFFNYRGLVGFATLVGAFLAVLAVYLAYDHYRGSRAAADRPVSIRVMTTEFSVLMPPGWKAYARTGETTVRLYPDTGVSRPEIVLTAAREAVFAYRALDENPAFIVRKLAQSLDGDAPVTLLGTEIVPVKPGVPAVHFIFEYAGVSGEGLFFYKADSEYLFWGRADGQDADGRRVIARFMRRAFASVSLPERRESLHRAVIQSGLISYEDSRKALIRVEKELALFRLHAARADAAPDANVVPALEHYQIALGVASSVRQERMLLTAPEFTRFRALDAVRNREVEEWFVLLAKQRAMGDLAAARAQARFIINHATLEDEAADAQRAKDALAAMPEPDQQKNDE